MDQEKITKHAGILRDIISEACREYIESNKIKEPESFAVILDATLRQSVFFHTLWDISPAIMMGRALAIYDNYEKLIKEDDER